MSMNLYFFYIGFLVIIVILRLAYNISKESNHKNDLPRLKLQTPINTAIIDENLDLVIGKMYDVKKNGIYLWTFSKKITGECIKCISLVLVFNTEKVIKAEYDAILELGGVGDREIFTNISNQEFNKDSPDITSYNLNGKNVNARFRIEKGSYLEIDGYITTYGLSLNIIYSVVDYIQGDINKTMMYENANFEFIEV
ncbi:hypothetical protein [Spirosoma pollinicola]|uniref:Uncharacterized protein n=1 Tax=Spirosoma pollinicola TaxID=2057025 RepID=A0A2K8YTG3_9BACT|nr:hypothetical protein [Spirosoma pollinicola]AUD00879.1 hypothetical protein CWM47_03040 [Spirosoma pollinicola]